MKNGLIRWIASITLLVMLLPMVLYILMKLSGEYNVVAWLHDFLETVPFEDLISDVGGFISSIAISLVLEEMDIDLLQMAKDIGSNWIVYNQINEWMMAIIAAIIYTAIEKIVGFLTNSTNKGLLNKFANINFQILLPFIALGFNNVVFQSFESQLQLLSDYARTIVLVIVYIQVAGRGIWCTILLGRAILQFIVLAIVNGGKIAWTCILCKAMLNIGALERDEMFIICVLLIFSIWLTGSGLIIMIEKVIDNAAD